MNNSIIRLQKSLKSTHSWQNQINISNKLKENKHFCDLQQIELSKAKQWNLH